MAVRLIPRWLGLPRLDFSLLTALLIIMGIGLAVLYSASNEDMSAVWRQAVRLGVGLFVLLVLSQVPPHILRLWTPWLYCLGVILLLATWFVGVGQGADRWLDFGFIRFSAFRNYEVGSAHDGCLVSPSEGFAS